MLKRTAIVASDSGLHARPATVFVKTAKALGVPVRVSVPGKDPVDARSILMVMALGATQGTQVTLEVDCADSEQHAKEQEALGELVRVIETNHDAPQPRGTSDG